MSTLVDYIRTHWHEVPDGATIPEGVEFVAVWNRLGSISHFGPGEPPKRLRLPYQPADITRFTPEPTFELPTTPGALIIAHDSLDETRRVFLRTPKGYWYDSANFYCDDEIRDPQPAIVIPNGLGVLDETDKRDRLDAAGDKWGWFEKDALWEHSYRAFGTLAALAARYGPLRFADEEGGEE